MHSITPGILEKSADEIEIKLKIIKPFSRSVHVDFIDGKFSEETSFLDANFFTKYKDEFFLEAHLMVEEPVDYVKQYAKAGFKKFIGHIEKMKSLEEFVALGQVFGEVGIAIDSPTSVENLKLPFDDLDEILLMSVKAGKSGQEFIEDTLEKIKKIREISSIKIAVDGGINDKNISSCSLFGAQRFIATSYIFNSNDPMQAFEKLSYLAQNTSV